MANAILGKVIQVFTPQVEVEKLSEEVGDAERPGAVEGALLLRRQQQGAKCTQVIEFHRRGDKVRLGAELSEGKDNAWSVVMVTHFHASDNQGDEIKHTIIMR